MKLPKFTQSNWFIAVVALAMGALVALGGRVFNDDYHFYLYVKVVFGVVLAVGFLGMSYVMRRATPRMMAMVSLLMPLGYVAVNSWVMVDLLATQNLPYAVVGVPAALFLIMAAGWWLRRRLVRAFKAESPADAVALDHQASHLRRYGCIAGAALALSIGLRAATTETYEVTFVSEAGTVMGTGEMVFHPFPFQSRTAGFKVGGECAIKLNDFSPKTRMEKDFCGVVNIRAEVKFTRVIFEMKKVDSVCGGSGDVFGFPVRFDFSPGWNDANIAARFPAMDTEVSKGKMLIGTCGGGYIGGEVVLKRK